MEAPKKRERPAPTKTKYTCYKCDALVGEFVKQKKFKRLCKKCLDEKRVKRNKSDPIRLIESRFRTALSAKKIKVPTGVDVGELVRRVCKRWENKSVLSDETDMTKLCITGYERIQPGVMPDENNLVLVTSAESITLSRYKTDEARRGKFPLEVTGKILLERTKKKE